MKKILLKSLAIGIAGLALTGCTYKTATMSYKPYNAFSQSEGGNLKYKEIAPIRACSSDFVWVSCVHTTKKTLRLLQDEAKIMGGNGVVDVKWEFGDKYATVPICQDQWGWFALYILPGFGPWVQKACAQGVAVKFLDRNISKE